MDNKYYKVLGADLMSPSTKFDYSPYLPKGNDAGEWLPCIESARLASDGYYISRYWNMWYKDGDRVFEVEYDAVVESNLIGVENQLCCAKIRLLREVTDEVLKTLCAKANAADSANAQLYNTGVYNTGSRNTGNFNTGNFNTGNRNTGNLNSGDFNTGDSNTGIDNVGDNNIGSGNVGCLNVGHSNTGGSNKGSYNAGSFNQGNANAGSFNVGSFNVGKWNIGNYQTGFFNTQEPFVRMFNKPTNLRQSQIRLPKWLNVKDCKAAFWTAPKEDIAAVLDLPNFDYDIFEQITKIGKADFDKKLAE